MNDALISLLDDYERQVDDAAAVRAEFEPVAVELVRLREVLEHHGVDMERVRVHNGAEVIREAIRFLEETVQARDLRHEQAQRWAKLNMGLLARIDSLKRRLGQVQ